MIAMVYVNRGRWIFDCPRDGCPWAYDAIAPTGATRYLHRCVGEPWTRTGRGCGASIELVWPSQDECEEIVWALSMRSLVATRNWKPTETVDQLLDENNRYLIGRDLEWLAENGIGMVA